MKCIDLMTLYQTQPCMQKEEPYIEIRKVKDFTKRFGDDSGEVNFADYWFEIVKSEKNLRGQYMGQHFSLLSDEESEENREQIWAQQDKKSVIVCLLKIRSDIEGFSVSEAKEMIQENIKEGKIFRTIDNADLILFLFGENKEKNEEQLNKIKKLHQKGINIFYSFYSVKGKLYIGDQKDYFIKKLDMSETPILCANEGNGAEWCLLKMKKLQEKIDSDVSSKNRKWVSYYQTLYQILNVLAQYEQKEKFKDLFYIFYPATVLFFEQLEAGQALIDAADGEKFVVKEKIETAISEFIDAMENLIHHIGVSCANILNVDGRNGLPYDIPIKLCMLYLAVLHTIVSILNDENYEYQFCLSPLAYSRPTTNIFDFGLEPEGRLVKISIARHKMYSPRALLGILAHEVSHYVGSCRQREVRADSYISVCTAILLELLLPDKKMYEELQKIKLTNEEKRAFENNWIERKNNLFSYFKKEMHQEIKQKNKHKIHKYHFAELSQDVEECIGKLLYDANNMLSFYMNKCSAQLRKNLIFISADSNLIEACEKERELLNEQLGSMVVLDQIYARIENVKVVFKEIYADISAILLLNIQPLHYLENYLQSEGCIPEEDSISNMLINRVALVHCIISESDKQWEKEWRALDGLKNEFLICLKEKVDMYLQSYENTESSSIKIEDTQEKKEIFDPFVVREIIDIEREYLRECKRAIESRLKDENLNKPIELLRNVYNHFVNDYKEEKSFEKFFEAYDELVACYKDSVKSKWEQKKSVD